MGNPGTSGNVFKGMTKILLAVAVVAAAVLIAVPAEASCHSFTVSASPSSPAEGEFVTVTVSRDGSASPSNVHVSTIDETAKAPADYSKLDQQVYFSGDTSKTLQVPTEDDSLSEGAETFRVSLSNPGGCTTSGLELGSDVRVTIRASDQSAQQTQPPPLQTAPQVTAAPRVTARATAAPSPTPSASPKPSASPTLTPFVAFPKGPQRGVVETTGDGGGLPLWPVIGLVLGAIVAGGGAWLFWYRRRVV